MMRLLFLLTASLTLLHPASLGAAGGFVFDVTMSPDTRDRILISSMLDNQPDAGFMPLKVTIDNRSTSDRSWSLGSAESVQKSTIQSSWTFAVKANTRSEFEILVPSKWTNFDYNWGGYLLCQGPGVETGSFQLPSTPRSSHSSNRLPFIALSDSLYANHWSQMEGQESALEGAGLDLSQATADWRAYSGLDQIWMTASEWNALPTDRQNAIQEAITFGADLILAYASPEEKAALKKAFHWHEADTSDVLSHGAGKIRLAQTSNQKILMSTAMSIMRAGPVRINNLESQPSGHFDETVPEILNSSPLVLLFIILFGIIAGPVNLFVLAPSGRRHRLFVTTPIISLLGALVLALSIFIQDGTGGSGSRLVHAQILPDQKRLLITQEQMARTGLLFSNRFTTTDATWVQPMRAETTAYRYRSGNLNFNLAADGSYHGDWFRSRTRQRHLIQTVRPSRAAIEFTGGPSPSIVSTMETTLKEIYAQAPDGSLWEAKDVKPGTRMNLTPVTLGQDWRKDRRVSYQLRGFLSDSIQKAESGAAHFFAEVDTSASLPAGLIVETLSSIRWQTPMLLISGPLTLKQP